MIKIVDLILNKVATRTRLCRTSKQYCFIMFLFFYLYSILIKEWMHKVIRNARKKKKLDFHQCDIVLK